MNAIERIKSQLSAAPVVLYMKGTPDFPQCGFSAQTVGALRACKAEFAHVNIFEDPEVREALKTYSNWPTFPQLYVNGELVGGCDITIEMYKSGELKQLLAEAGAVAVGYRHSASEPRASAGAPRRRLGLDLQGTHGRQTPAARLEHALELIADRAEEIRRALRIVGGRMGGAVSHSRPAASVARISTV